MIEAAIQSLLLAASPTPLASGTQIEAGRAREGWQAPYIVHFLVGPNPLHAHDGPLELRQDTVQVSCYGSTYGQARSEAEAVRGLLDGYVGTVGAVAVKACVWSDARVIYETDTRLWHASVDFDVQYVG